MWFKFSQTPLQNKPLIVPFSPEAIKIINDLYRKSKFNLGEAFGRQLAANYNWSDPEILTNTHIQKQHLYFTDKDKSPSHPMPYIPENLKKLQAKDHNLDLISHIRNQSTSSADLLLLVLKGIQGVNWY